MISRLKFDISDLIDEKLSHIPNYIWESDSTTFCDLQMAGGQYIQKIVEKLRKFSHSDENIRKRVFGFSEKSFYLQYVKSNPNLIGTFNLYNENINMKFDVQIGNDPYHKKVGPKKTEPIWDIFVEKRLSLLKEDGYLALIHPSGWRNIDGRFKYIQDYFKEFQLHYLKMYSEKDALKIFDASIVFDLYVLKKTKNDDVLTTIKTFDNTILEKNISDMEFIPNNDFDLVFPLLAKQNEETVNIIHSWSAYETRKKYMSKNKNSEYKYPCVCNVDVNSNPTLMYSNTNKNGHFGISKLICGSASSGTNFLNDVDGKYGITQFSFGIVDSIENLDKIKTALSSTKFQKIIQNIPHYSSAINFKILSKFRKDFWKEFV